MANWPKGLIMTTEVTATVVGGMLKPDQSLLLADHTRVHLTIEPIFEKQEPAAAWEALKAPAPATAYSWLGKALHPRGVA
jgi:hypothetical protein